MPDFWFSVHKRKLDQYRKKAGGDFNFIIYKSDDPTKFYSIPASKLNDILGSHETYSHGAWEFTIRDHTLSVHGNGKFDILKYYQNSANIPHLYDDPIFQGIYNPSESTQEDTLNQSEIFDEDYDNLSRTEGGKLVRTVTKFERDPKLRQIAFDLHGYSCAVCGFNFGSKYGEWGKDYAEVHHVIPFSELKKVRQTNPQTDLNVLCADCHRMIHRKRGFTLSIDELKEKMLK